MVVSPRPRRDSQAEFGGANLPFHGVLSFRRADPVAFGAAREDTRNLDLAVGGLCGNGCLDRFTGAQILQEDDVEVLA